MTSASDSGSASGSPSDSSDSSGSSSDSAPPAVPSDSDTSSPAPNPTFQVTDLVTDGGFKLKINSIQLPYTPPAGSQFTPAATRAWMMLDFQVTNVTSQQLMFDTINGFDLRDNANVSHLASIVPGDTLPKGKLFQDHEVNPGDTARGEVVFDVPQNGGPYRLLFVGNLWHSDQTPPAILLNNK